MKRSEIIEILKQMNPRHIKNNGPTSICFSTKGSKKPKAFSVSEDKDHIIVTTGKYLFKHKYRINKKELYSKYY
jgi:hypothetical protein